MLSSRACGQRSKIGMAIARLPWTYSSAPRTLPVFGFTRRTRSEGRHSLIDRFSPPRKTRTSTCYWGLDSTQTADHDDDTLGDGQLSPPPRRLLGDQSSACWTLEGLAWSGRGNPGSGTKDRSLLQMKNFPGNWSDHTRTPARQLTRRSSTPNVFIHSTWDP